MNDKYYGSLLGPSFNYFCLRLEQYIELLDDGDTTFLFCTRAGYSIFEIYKSYLEAKGRDVPESCKVFYISRMLASKVGLVNGSKKAEVIIKNEYQFNNASEFIRGIFSSSPNSVELLKDVNFDAVDEQGALAYIEDFLDGKDYCNFIRYYLNAVESVFSDYLEHITNGKNKVVLIDSGWQSTIHNLLQDSYKKYQFSSLLFGRIFSPSSDFSNASTIHGVVFEKDIESKFNKFDSKMRNAVFLLHRHIVEDILEPKFRSIEEVQYSQDGFRPTLVEFTENADYLKSEFIAVLNYVKKYATESLCDSISKYESSLRNIYDAVVHPTEIDLQILGGVSRSIDFGKPGEVSVLIKPEDRFEGDSKARRISDAIWTFGQIAVEHKDKNTIKELQVQYIKSEELVLNNDRSEELPLVAIITRTKNRPILLKRAAKSVANQSYNNYVWVVVNDGGNESEVVKCILESSVSLRKVRLVSNPVSLGMEAASNRGINSIESDYIVIHDDDDSWEPEFLKETVSFIKTKPPGVFEGVISDTTYVSEEIRDDKVIIHDKRPYNPWVSAVHLAEMAHGNFFAPIAFLFSRRMYDQVGGFDEDLPVLGDWDFNLRFLANSNIGVVKKALANYHHRDVNIESSSQYSNSVIGGISKHQEYEPVVRNKYIRNTSGVYQQLSALMSISYAGTSLRHSILQVMEQIQVHLPNKFNERTAFEKEVHRQELQKLASKLIHSADRDSISQYFDEKFYLELHSDVAEAIKSNVISSAFEHFINFGISEGREFRLGLK